MATTDSQLLSPFEERYQHDAYSPLDFKRVLASHNSYGRDWMAPTWVGDHRRRLQAYITLRSYIDNSSRVLLTALTQEERQNKADRREYGDAGLIVETTRAALLGDQQTIVVTGADEYDPSKPETADTLDDQDQLGTAKAAFERQQFLRQWAEDERLVTKLIETERNAVSMGDGVYSLGWDPLTQRVALRTWDPGCYFPVLADGDENRYPERVHLAWELVNEDPRDYTLRVRRITYDLREVPAYAVPWSDEPATKECYLSDATYVVEKEVRTPEDFTDKVAIYTEDSEGPIKDRPLGIDFVPVIHIPNTVAIADHFGQSSIAKILQVLDDIQATDSDLQKASAMTGSPMVVVSGSLMATGKIRVGPGEGLNVGENGSATTISGADGLAGLAQFRDDLLTRATTNARLPEAALGRVEPSDFSSGLHLLVSYGPMTALIAEMRLVRKDKYRIINRFVQRFYIKQGILQGPVFDADLLFGSFLPSDQAGMSKLVVELVNAKMISRQTGMKMLQEAGVPIKDPAAEEQEIDSRDFEAAIQLLDATGNVAAVEKMLGIQIGTSVPSLEVALPNQGLELEEE